jgi:predicted MFS family arabinose efflux permease
LGTFVAQLVFIVPTPFFPLMASDLRVSLPLLGQVMTAMLLLSALFGLIVGPLADRSGHRRVILVGLIAALLCLLDFGLAPTFLILLPASVAGAVATAAVVGPASATASTTFTGSAARHAVGWTTAAQAGTAIVGIPALAALSTVAGWRAAFVAASLAALVAIAVGLRWLPQTPHRPRESLRLQSMLSPYRPLLRNGAMRRLYGATMLGAVCWYGLLTYLGAFLAGALGMDAGQAGLAYMVAGTGFFLGSLAAGGPLARIPVRLLVGGGYALMALLMALTFSARFGTAGSALLLAGAAFAMGFAVVGMIASLTAQTPSGAGTTLTFNTALFNVGAASGGALGGVLLAVAGYGALAIGLPLFGVAAACLSWPSAARSFGGAKTAA